MNIENAAKSFIHVKKTLGSSTETLKNYKSCIDRFCRFASSLGTTDVCELCCESVYYRYIDYLINSSIKDVSVTSYARGLKVFLNWMMEKGWIDPFLIRLPKYQRTIPQTFTDDQVKMLISPVKGEVSEKEYMTYVIANTFMATGIRLGSLINLKVKHIDFSGGTIEINSTKNKIPVKLPVNKELLAILMRYIVRFNLSPDDYLFCTAAGTKYAKRTIEDYVKQYELERGIVVEKVCHCFRHTFAKNYYLRTHDVVMLSKILDQQDLSTTFLYLRSLGLGITDTLEYNPQAEFVAEIEAPRQKRRKKIKLYDDDEDVSDNDDLYSGVYYLDEKNKGNRN